MDGMLCLWRKDPFFRLGLSLVTSRVTVFWSYHDWNKVDKLNGCAQTKVRGCCVYVMDQSCASTS